MYNYDLLELKLQLPSYKNVSQTASKILTTFFYRPLEAQNYNSSNLQNGPIKSLQIVKVLIKEFFNCYDCIHEFLIYFAKCFCSI